MSEVIVGVDESEGAADALRWAVREAELHGWTVTAVMAWGFLDQHHAIVGEGFDPDYGKDDARAALDTIVVAALGADAAGAVERRVACDLPALALLDTSSGSELLVVGARGLGGFRGLLLGSVSQHCLHHVTTPIAIVRAGPDRAAERTERIVVAVDGSETSQRALRWALEEGRLRRAAVAVVHASNPLYLGGYPYSAGSIDPAIFEHASRRVLDSAIAAEDTSGLPVPVEQISRSGGAAAVILEAAEDAELVVMGSRGLGGFKGVLLGSVTTQVSRHARCPVVVVPPGA